MSEPVGIVEAMETVEKLRKDGWIVHIIASEYTLECKIECGPGARGRFSAEGDSLPEAITMAALKALDNS